MSKHPDFISNMVSEPVTSPTFYKNCHLVQPSTHQPPTIDDNSLNLSFARESSVFHCDRLVCLIIWRGGWDASLVTLTILYESQKKWENI